MDTNIDMIDEEEVFDPLTSHSLVPSNHPSVTFTSHASPHVQKHRLTVPLPLPVNGSSKPDIAVGKTEPTEASIIVPISPRSSIPHSASSSTNPLISKRKASFHFLRKWSPRQRHLCYLASFIVLLFIGLLTALIITLSHPRFRIYTVINNQDSNRDDLTGLARKTFANGTQQTYSVCLSESCVKAGTIYSLDSNGFHI